MRTSAFVVGALVTALFGSTFFLWAAQPESSLPALEASGFGNVDFEQGEPGAQPPGWFVPKVLVEEGFSAVLTTNQPRQGKQCVEIRWPKETTSTRSPFANLMQRVDAAPLRGKRIKVTAAIRVVTNTPGARAQMWLRVDRPGGMGAFDNMNDRPVVGGAWADYSITADIASDARVLNLGLITLNGATAWWDDVRCEVVSEFKTLTEPPRPLSDAGLSNLVALARLLGYVRHFHPSDQAAANDWLAFAVSAIPSIENATDPPELAAKLEAAFYPIAPTVRVFESGKSVPALPAELLADPNAPPLKVRVWEHFGYAQSKNDTRNVYRSERVVLDAHDLALLPAYAQPTNVFRAELGRGIACVVPTALFANEGGTLPHLEPTPSEVGPETRLSVEHRGARLATVMLTWNILQHFYPYFDVVDTDWSQELKVALRGAAIDPDEAAFYQTLLGMIVALKDGHGALMGPGAPMNVGLPIRVGLVENQVVVVAVPETLTNVHPGDVVERLDGWPATDLFERTARAMTAATAGWRNYKTVQRFGAGPPNSSAKLVVRDAAGNVRSITLQRTGIQLPPTNGRPPRVHELKPGIFYVDVTRLKDEELKEALPRLAQARGLVFDMRGYPLCSPNWLTHLSPQVLRSAHWNIPKYHRPDQSDVTWEDSGRWTLWPGEPQLTTNRVFLVDGSVISYAESIMGIVEAYRLGAIVGEPTAGTNGNVNPTDLALGYSMMWTGMKVLKHDGSRHHGIGIHPTVPVSRTVKGIREGRDEQLERALALVE